MENLLFLLLLAGAALLKWIAERVEQSKKDAAAAKESHTAEETAPQDQQAPSGSEEERIRRFLEALGQPASSRPPPKVRRRTGSAPKTTTVFRPQVPPFVSPLPPLTTQPPPEPVTPSEVVAEMPPSPRPEPPRRKVLVTPKAATFEIREAFSPKTLEPAILPRAGTGPVAATSLPALLGSPDGLRQAVILREVFGPPRSLQALDHLANV